MTNRSFLSAIGTAALIATVITPAFADTTTQNGNVNQTTTQDGNVASINNSATLAGNVIRAASGNIGLNNASGVGNLQSNMLVLHGANGVSGDQDAYKGTLNINQNINHVGDVTVQGSKLAVTLGKSTTDASSSSSSSNSASNASAKNTSASSSNASLNEKISESLNESLGSQSASQSGSTSVSSTGPTKSASENGSSSASSSIGGSGNVAGHSSTSATGSGSKANSANASNEASANASLNFNLAATASATDNSSSATTSSKSASNSASNSNSSNASHSVVYTYDFVGSGGPTASIAGSVGQDSSGNIGANNAAGAFNDQSNATLISVDPMSLAQSTAAINLNQSLNHIGNIVVVNSTASMDGDAFRGASGNIGINQAAGALNQQSNALVIH